MKLFHRAWPGWLWLLATAACAAAPRVSSRPGPSPKTAADRRIVHLVERAQAEAEHVATSSAARSLQRARLVALRAEALDVPEERLSVPWRLDRALLLADLRQTLNPSRVDSPRIPVPELGPELDRIRATLARSQIHGIEPTRPWTVSSTAGPPLLPACELAFSSLATQWLAELSISEARRHFRTPDFGPAWARLGCLILGELGDEEAAASTAKLDLPLFDLYRRVAAHRGRDHRPLDTYRVLLGLGSLEAERTEPALVQMGLLPPR